MAKYRYYYGKALKEEWHRLDLLSIEKRKTMNQCRENKKVHQHCNNCSYIDYRDCAIWLDYYNAYNNYYFGPNNHRYTIKKEELL
jgi:hypothetical protein